MKTCSTSGHEQKEATRKGPVSGLPVCMACYQWERRNDKPVTSRGNVTKNVTNVTSPIPEIGRSVTQGKRELVKEHNAAFKFEIIGDYHLDKETWDRKPNGRYVNTRIRDALGFQYDPTKQGKKPPFSVVKGCREENRMVEVYINLDLTDRELKDLLIEIKAYLEQDLGPRTGGLATLKGSDSFKWRQGPEEGKDRRDYTVKSPFVENLGKQAPELVGHQAERKPEDEHDNSIMGDGSHPKHMEGNSREQANINLSIHEDVNAYNEELTLEEATEELSRGANYIKQTKDRVTDLKEKADYHKLSDDNASAAILRRIKEGSAKTDLELMEFRIAQGRLEGTFEQKFDTVADMMGVFAEQMADFGESADNLGVNIKSHLKLVDAVNNAAEAMREASESRPKKAHLWKGRRG